ncbi:MAG: cytochrome-c peroxidase [Bdellovibrionales bacterium]
MKRTLPLLLVLIGWVVQCTTAEREPASASNSLKIQLGRKLFFDPRLSADGSISCSTCHIPRFAFTNNSAFATGVGGRRGDRNVPTLVNRRGTTRQFWDMRADSLEDQVVRVLQSPNEMGVRDLQQLVQRLNASELRAEFETVFGGLATVGRLAEALVAYEQTLRSGTAPYDRYVSGDRSALSPTQVRGMKLFFKKYRCDSCHSGPNFSDEQRRVRCYPFTSNLTEVTSAAVEKGQMFKTPTLRNLIYTEPYMHNGALSTLEEAVEFYTPSMQIDETGDPDPSRPIVLINAKEKTDLVEFLKSLSADQPFVEDKN